MAFPTVDSVVLLLSRLTRIPSHGMLASCHREPRLPLTGKQGSLLSVFLYV